MSQTINRPAGTCPRVVITGDENGAISLSVYNADFRFVLNSVIISSYTDDFFNNSVKVSSADGVLELTASSISITTPNAYARVPISEAVYTDLSGRIEGELGRYARKHQREYLEKMSSVVTMTNEMLDMAGGFVYDRTLLQNIDAVRLNLRNILQRSGEILTEIGDE